MYTIRHIDETDSTNHWLKANGREDMVVWADYQTAGRGCGKNTWESERGKNLLFSVMLRPEDLPARQQFRISMAVSVALCEVLSAYAEGFSIKWPNDIYWQDRKICGILIENRVAGQVIAESIIGIGLNVNQRLFLSDAPNPVALCQIVGHDIDREVLLGEFLEKLPPRFSPPFQGEGTGVGSDTSPSPSNSALPSLPFDSLLALATNGTQEGAIASSWSNLLTGVGSDTSPHPRTPVPPIPLHSAYEARLYRRGESHAYVDHEGPFMATLTGVLDDGRLRLKDETGRERTYAFKEVQFVI